MSAGACREAGPAAPYGTRGLLLDFGAVITVSVFERHRQTEQRLGLSAGTLLWEGPIAPDTDPLWQSMQRDELSEREYWARRAAELGALVGESGWDMGQLLSRVREENPQDVVRPAMRELIADCRTNRIKVGILSNEMELFYGRAFLDGMNLLQHMDVVVDATHTGILKPDARAYEHALAAMRLRADEVLFVDDQFRNIAGAVKVGLKIQHFDLRDVGENFAAMRVRLGLPIQVTR